MQPPCLLPDTPMNDCARRLYSERVLGHIDLPGDWAGWRLRGKWLISPGGHRINPQRLRGILFREDGEQRVARARSKAGHRGSVCAFPNPLVNRVDPLGTGNPE